MIPSLSAQATVNAIPGSSSLEAPISEENKTVSAPFAAA